MKLKKAAVVLVESLSGCCNATFRENHWLVSNPFCLFSKHLPGSYIGEAFSEHLNSCDGTSSYKLYDILC